MATLKTIYNSGSGGAQIITSNTGVQSLNGASGSVNIAAGTGISVTGSGQTITIANTEAAGGVTSVTASGAGITATPTTGAVVLQNTGVTSISAANSGISVSAGSGAVGISNTGVLSITAGTGLSSAISSGNYTLNNTGLTGVGINSGAASSNGNLNLIAGSNVTLSQSGLGVTIAASGGSSGVSSITAGTGISASSSTGAVTISNQGLLGIQTNGGAVSNAVNLNLVAGSNITLSQASGAVTINSTAAGPAIYSSYANQYTWTTSGVGSFDGVLNYYRIDKLCHVTVDMTQVASYTANSTLASSNGIIGRTSNGVIPANYAPLVTTAGMIFPKIFKDTTAGYSWDCIIELVATSGYINIQLVQPALGSTTVTSGFPASGATLVPQYVADFSYIIDA